MAFRRLRILIGRKEKWGLSSYTRNHKSVMKVRSVLQLVMIKFLVSSCDIISEHVLLHYQKAFAQIYKDRPTLLELWNQGPYKHQGFDMYWKNSSSRPVSHNIFIRPR